MDKRAIYPPGEFLREELEFRKWGFQNFADCMRWKIDELDAFVKGDKRLLAHEAEKIGALLGTSAVMWMNLEMQWRHSKC